MFLWWKLNCFPNDRKWRNGTFTRSSGKDSIPYFWLYSYGYNFSVLSVILHVYEHLSHFTFFTCVNDFESRVDSHFIHHSCVYQILVFPESHSLLDSPAPNSDVWRFVAQDIEAVISKQITAFAYIRDHLL